MFKREVSAMRKFLSWLVWSDAVFDAFMLAICLMLLSLPVLVYCRIYG